MSLQTWHDCIEAWDQGLSFSYGVSCFLKVKHEKRIKQDKKQVHSIVTR